MTPLDAMLDPGLFRLVPHRLPKRLAREAPDERPRISTRIVKDDWRERIPGRKGGLRRKPKMWGDTIPKQTTGRADGTGLRREIQDLLRRCALEAA